MTFWGGSGSGSGSADACLWLMDPDPAMFVIDLQDASKKLIFFNTIFSAYYFLKLHLHHFSKIKVKKSHKIVGIKVFLTIFAWWLKDPVPDPEKDPDPDPYLWLVDPDPGDPKTHGSSGSGFGSATLVLFSSGYHNNDDWLLWAITRDTCNRDIEELRWDPPCSILE